MPKSPSITDSVPLQKKKRWKKYEKKRHSISCPVRTVLRLDIHVVRRSTTNECLQRGTQAIFFSFERYRYSIQEARYCAVQEIRPKVNSFRLKGSVPCCARTIPPTERKTRRDFWSWACLNSSNMEDEDPFFSPAFCLTSYFSSFFVSTTMSKDGEAIDEGVSCRTAGHNEEASKGDGILHPAKGRLGGHCGPSRRAYAGSIVVGVTLVVPVTPSLWRPR